MLWVPNPTAMPTTPEPGDRGPDVEVELAQDHHQRDEEHEQADDVRAQRLEGVHPLPDLDRRQLLGGALGRLAVEQRLDDAVDEQAGEPDDDERDDDDEEDRHAGVAEPVEELVAGARRTGASPRA